MQAEILEQGRDRRQVLDGRQDLVHAQDAPEGLALELEGPDDGSGGGLPEGLPHRRRKVARKRREAAAALGAGVQGSGREHRRRGSGTQLFRPAPGLGLLAADQDMAVEARPEEGVGTEHQLIELVLLDLAAQSDLHFPPGTSVTLPGPGLPVLALGQASFQAFDSGGDRLLEVGRRHPETEAKGLAPGKLAAQERAHQGPALLRKQEGGGGGEGAGVQGLPADRDPGEGGGAALQLHGRRARVRRPGAGQGQEGQDRDTAAHTAQ